MRFQARWLSRQKSGVAFAPRCQLEMCAVLSGERTAPAGWTTGPGHGVAKGHPVALVWWGGCGRGQSSPVLGMKTLQIVVELLSGFSCLVSFCFWVCVLVWGEGEGGAVSYARSVRCVCRADRQPCLGGAAQEMFTVPWG